MQPGRFRSEARNFAGRLTSLLNRTVCNGPSIGTFTQRGHDYAIVGFGVSDRDPTAQLIPIDKCTGCQLHMHMFFQLERDKERDFLMVTSSSLGLCLDDAGERVLFHADYERNKDVYAEAHLQVWASSDDWTELLESRPEQHELSRLHLPAGGRRYRTSVEDIVEFIVNERLATPKDDWQTVVDESRREFEDRQLRAAVRRHPDTAREVLEGL